MPSLWAWGTGQAGQLGDGEGKASLLPTGVSDSTFSANIRQIAAGESHCVALDDAGAVYAWGRTREGQAGRVDPTPQKEPVVIASLLEHTVNKIAGGALTCYALTADGVVHAWGCLHESAADAEIHDDAAGYGPDDGDGDVSLESQARQRSGGGYAGVGGVHAHERQRLLMSGRHLALAVGAAHVGGAAE